MAMLKRKPMVAEAIPAEPGFVDEMRTEPGIRTKERIEGAIERLDQLKFSVQMARRTLMEQEAEMRYLIHGLAFAADYGLLTSDQRDRWHALKPAKVQKKEVRNHE